jgi:hypothetical protein
MTFWTPQKLSALLKAQLVQAIRPIFKVQRFLRIKIFSGSVDSYVLGEVARVWFLN